jgi:hypothetical protein
MDVLWLSSRCAPQKMLSQCSWNLATSPLVRLLIEGGADPGCVLASDRFLGACDDRG